MDEVADDDDVVPVVDDGADEDDDVDEDDEDDAEFDEPSLPASPLLANELPSPPAVTLTCFFLDSLK